MIRGLFCEHGPYLTCAPGLTKEEISKNPQGMLDVLGFYTDGQGGPPAPGNAPSDAGKYMNASPGPVSLKGSLRRLCSARHQGRVWSTASSNLNIPTQHHSLCRSNSTPDLTTRVTAP